MTPPLLIQGARHIDPARGVDSVGDLFVREGLVDAVPASLPAGTRVVEAAGLVLAPGFWDLHVHFREPGGEAQETIRSGSLAAARGGFTRVVMMPNTKPALDTPDWVRRVLQEGERVGLCRVMTSACITKGREGREVADLEALREAGAVAFTDDGCTVQDDGVMEAAMQIAARLRLPLMDHAQDSALERAGVMHDGILSRKFGLPGIPTEAETRIVERDLRLAARTGGRVHIQHVTSGEAAAAIAAAKARGVPVTAEVTPHHLALCDADIDPERPDAFKMNPPLRSAADRDALRAACASGVLDTLATDHAPHTREAKAQGFLRAPFGVIGLETAIGVTYTQLVQAGLLSLSEWVSRWTGAPARVLGFAEPTLAPGAPADLVLLDLEKPWRVASDRFASLSRNTSFEGWPLTGRARVTILGGRIVWSDLPA